MFLEQNKPILFNDMILNETLFLHLWEVQQTCVKRMELLMEELLANNPAPDKATQQLVWVAHMNSLKAQAEESVLRELVYEENINNMLLNKICPLVISCSLQMVDIGSEKQQLLQNTISKV